MTQDGDMSEVRAIICHIKDGDPRDTEAIAQGKKDTMWRPALPNSLRRDPHFLWVT